MIMMLTMMMMTMMSVKYVTGLNNPQIIESNMEKTKRTNNISHEKILSAKKNPHILIIFAINN